MRTLLTIEAVFAVVLAAGAALAAEADSDYQPLSRSAPEFPEDCTTERLESHYVIVEYDLTIEGTTENVRIIESSNECFHASSVEAASQFLYQPRMIGGIPVPVQGLRNKFTYTTDSLRDSVESELQPIKQLIYDGDGATALTLLAAFEKKHGRKVSRYEHATFLWMRGVAHMLDNNHPAARTDLRAALDTNDLYPETVDWLRSLLSDVEAKNDN